MRAARAVDARLGEALLGEVLVSLQPVEHLDHLAITSPGSGASTACADASPGPAPPGRACGSSLRCISARLCSRCASHCSARPFSERAGALVFTCFGVAGGMLRNAHGLAHLVLDLAASSVLAGTRGRCPALADLRRCRRTRRDLVLDHLTRVWLLTASSRSLTWLIRRTSSAHAGVEFERVAAGRGLRSAEHHADLACGIWLVKITMRPAIDAVSLRSACDIKRACRPTAESPISPSISRLGHQRRHRIDHHQVDGVGTHQRVGDLQPAHRCRAADEQVVPGSRPAHLACDRIQRVLRRR